MRVASHTPIDEALVERMRDRLIEACDPQYLYLFGSVAQGEETPESDVDLLVVTTPSAGTTVSETTAQLRSLIREDGLSIDLIVQTPEQFRRQLRLPGFIARTARQDGRLLHSTEPLPPMPDPEYHDAAHEWYEQGDRDRRMARLLLSAAEKMSPFAVAVRYPNPENVPTEEEARGLAEQVDTIRSEVRDRLFPKE